MECSTQQFAGAIGSEGDIGRDVGIANDGNTLRGRPAAKEDVGGALGGGRISGRLVEEDHPAVSPVAGARGGGGGGGADGDAGVAADGFGARRLQGGDEFVGGGGEAVGGDEGGERRDADRQKDCEHGDRDHQFDEGEARAAAGWVAHSLLLADLALNYDAVGERMQGVGALDLIGMP